MIGKEIDSRIIFNTISKTLNIKDWRMKDEADADEEIEHFCKFFKQPLQNAGTKICIPDILEQWHSLYEFANEFFGVSY